MARTLPAWRRIPPTSLSIRRKSQVPPMARGRPAQAENTAVVMFRLGANMIAVPRAAITAAARQFVCAHSGMESAIRAAQSVIHVAWMAAIPCAAVRAVTRHDQSDHVSPGSAITGRGSSANSFICRPAMLTCPMRNRSTIRRTLPCRSEEWPRPIHPITQDFE